MPPGNAGQQPRGDRRKWRQGANLERISARNPHKIMRDLQSYVDEEYRKAPGEAMRLYDGKTIDEAFPHLLKSQLESRLNKLEAGIR